ncbi:MAG: hypothetical protein KOO69_03100 [Victivallales bacterium]|nr:hypothetical protein [Victivallales bacterium]
MMSYKLLKTKNKIRQKEWRKAQKFYASKYKKDLDRLQADFLVELKVNVDLQHQKDLRLVDQKIKEIKELKRQVAIMEKEHRQYLELKLKLEFIQNKLALNFKMLFSTMGKVQGCFDEIGYVDFKHKKIKE